jgi:hypothetical protein
VTIFPANPFGLKVSVVAEPNPLSFQLAVVIPELKFSRTPCEYPNEIVKRQIKKSNFFHNKSFIVVIEVITTKSSKYLISFVPKKLYKVKLNLMLKKKGLNTSITDT